MSSVYSLKAHGKKWPTLLVILAVIAMVGMIVAVLAVRVVYQDRLNPVSNSQRAQLIEIPAGISAKEIAHKLEDADLIRSAWAFEWYVRNHGLRDKLQAGTYYIRPNQNVAEIAAILTQGLVATDLVTILPAQRLDQIKTSLIRSGFNEENVDKALKPEQYKDHPALVDKPLVASLEGYLYPETFHKNANTTPETIIRLSLDEMHRHLTPELRAGIVRQGFTVHEGIILASIIEQEVGHRDQAKDLEEKKKAAQVFLRRQMIGMALESDPTAVYGAIIDGIQLPADPAESASAAIRHSSSHNTYEHPGLPPTPISNVSVNSLEAIANPSETDFLFFVAGDDGTTYFSKTLQEHQELTRKYCQKLCSSTP